MATTRRVQGGLMYIDYTPGVAVSAGDVVVQGDLCAFADSDIAANQKGALAVDGVREFPKAATSGSAIAVGVKVYWNAVASQATTTAGANKYLGKTVAAAADADTTVNVLCNVGD